jgi:hypothetical protein
LDGVRTEGKTQPPYHTLTQLSDKTQEFVKVGNEFFDAELARDDSPPIVDSMTSALKTPRRDPDHHHSHKYRHPKAHLGLLQRFESLIISSEALKTS